MPKIKVALIGVGNCAASFIQGIQFYSKPNTNQLGLRNPVLAGYTPKDIEIVAAFDVDNRKVGLDLSEAIFAKPNNTPKICDVPSLGVKVSMGPLLDGVGESTRALVEISNSLEANIVETLQSTDAEIIINLLPSGAVDATRFYALQAIVAGCAFINATPNFIASDPVLAQQFEDAALPLVGDDLVDQIGSTGLHKTLLKLLSDSGVRISETYQLDVGGGTESVDTIDRSRDAKRNIKTEAVASSLAYKTDVVAGSTDYVDFLQNKRDSYFWISGTYFCNAPLKIDLKFQTVDAPNAGSVLFDVVRALKVGLNRKQKGVLEAVCAYGFKHPPKVLSMQEVEDEFVKFIT
ncbi:MAG: inositol-3-phosphate synthase [Nitrososphaerota archaeon]|nr:inositol-3-phosphate synthase [Nitrososphaerota archaeon]